MNYYKLAGILSLALSFSSESFAAKISCDHVYKNAEGKTEILAEVFSMDTESKKGSIDWKGAKIPMYCHAQVDDVSQIWNCYRQELALHGFSVKLEISSGVVGVQINGTLYENHGRRNEADQVLYCKFVN